MRLDKVIRDEKSGISLSIKKNGIECEEDEKRTILCCTEYIKEWISEVVNEGHVEVILQQVMQQCDAMNQTYSGIEYEIFIDELGEERMMLTGLNKYVDYGYKKTAVKCSMFYNSWFHCLFSFG